MEKSWKLHTIAEDSDEPVAVLVPSFKQFLDAMETARGYIQSLTGMEEEIIGLLKLED